MQYKNPILPGFYPDPSICKANDTYYLVNSSFEYFPSIPIFESKDLINWHQIGHVLDEYNMITLKQGFPNKTGIYAPTIRFYQGMFYVVCTNVAYDEIHDGNFIVSAKSPSGPWSKPIFLDLPGIDPSLFFDDDGSVYYTGTHGNIYICKIDVHTGTILESRKEIWGGTGGCAPEGPHLYKKDGWYYLMISEGGTEHGHMVTISRSRSPYGPYESYEGNPILSNRSLEMPLRATGHADLICDAYDQWWAVCLGIRVISYPLRHNLGRETLLAPVEWHEGWPIIGRNGIVDETIILDRISSALPSAIESKLLDSLENIELDDFTTGNTSLVWNTIYRPLTKLVLHSKAGLELFGNSTKLSEAKPLAWYGRRQCHHVCEITTKMIFEPQNDGEEAGLTIYLNNTHHYEIALTQIEGEKKLIFRRQIGSLYKVENMVTYLSSNIEFKLVANHEDYVFSYKGDETWHELGRGEVMYLTTEVGGCFTGNYIALYATGNGEMSKQKSTFKWFEYKY